VVQEVQDAQQVQEVQDAQYYHKKERKVMGTIITFINEKGGVGKSSCCFNVAWELTKRKKVLLIDMDGQRANLTFFCGITKKEDMLTIFNVLQSNSNIKDTIKGVKKNLDIIPASQDVSNLTTNAKISKYKKVLEEVKNEYDYIFIDVNPTPGWGHILALSVSNYIIAPMLPDVTSLEANNGIIESIEEIRETSNPNLKVLGLVFNKHTPRTNLSKQVLEISGEMASVLNTKVFESKIRNAVSLSENVYYHIGITDYDENSAAAEDVRNFIKEIESRIEEER